MHCKKGNKFEHTQKEEGFTLIEVLIALAIFSIGFLAVASMQLKSTGGSTNARILTEASVWAQDRVETLMSFSYNDPAITPADGTERSQDINNYRISWTAWDNSAGATPWGNAAAINTKIIRVTVTDLGRNNSSSTVAFVRARDV